MSAKVICAGIVAGIVLFLWGFLSHMVLRLGEVGIKTLPEKNQAQVSAVLLKQVPDAGLYFIPGYDNTLTGDALIAELEEWTKAHEAGPTGLLVFNPIGSTPMSPMQLGIQFVLDVLIGISAALIVSFFRQTSFICKVLLVASLGLFAFLETDAAYFNWFHFPMDYSLAQLADKIVGMLFVGVILATMIKCSPAEK